jgi:hypothetical protein
VPSSLPVFPFQPPQQADNALAKTYGFRTQAYHGSVQHSHMTQWDRQRWMDLMEEVDVLVMTPDVLLHTLSHGVFKVRRALCGEFWGPSD